MMFDEFRGGPRVILLRVSRSPIPGNPISNRLVGVFWRLFYSEEPNVN